MNEQQVLGLDLAGIRTLTALDFHYRRMTSKEFTHIAGLAGGYYEHGEPRATDPHMQLHSRLHSGHYIDCSSVLAETTICEILAAQMIEHCLGGEVRIDWVVSAALAGIPLGQEIARQLGARAGYVEKGQDGKLSDWRFQIPKGSRVLLANELVTTSGGSAFETKQTVRKLNGEPVEFLPFGAFMVDRCSKSAVLTDGTKIRGLFKFDFPTYPPDKDQCPFCKVGSPVINGKSALRQFWRDRLARQQAFHRHEQQGGVNWQAGGQ